MSSDSSVIYSADGTTKDFTITFEYLDQGDIKVFVDNILSTDVSSNHSAEILNDTTVRVTKTSDGSAPVSGAIVKLSRVTPISEPVASFVDGSTIPASTLNEVNNQLLFAMQEAADRSDDAMPLADDDKYDARNKIIKNVADPVDDQDAVNKRFFEGTFEPQLDAKVSAAELAESNASASEDAASGSAAQASSSAAQASLSETNAASSVIAAETHKVGAEDAQVAAEAALDEFTDLYLGPKASDPSLDNDGDALQAGALYFNTSAKEMRAYNLGDTAWYSATDAAASASAAASSATNADTARSAAETAQGQAEAARDAAQGHANTTTGHVTDALGHANAAAGHATTAAGHVTTASGHATTASTKAGEASGSATAAAGSAAQAATSETNAGNSASAAATSEANAAASAGVGPTLAQAVRARYAIKTRRPAVVLDPVEETYFSPAGPVVIGDLVDHVRNSAAVSTDGDGVVTSVPANTLRTDHHVLKEGIWQRAGLRVDKQATNLLLHSEAVGETGWSKGGVTITADDGVAPDGTATANLITGTNGATSYVGQNVTVPAGYMTFSAYVRGGTGSILGVRLFGFDESATTDAVWFDVSAGSVLTQQSGIYSAGIQEVGGGWYRVRATINTTSDLSGSVFLYLSGSDGSFTSGGGYLHLWGAQVEAGVIPTSYIKTEAAQVTRAADVIDIDAADLPTPAKACTILLTGAIDRVDADSAEEAVLFNWHIGANTEQIKLVLNSLGANDGLPELFSVAGGVSASATGAGVGLGQSGVGVEFRIALVVTATSLQVIMNGAAGAAVTHANGLPDLSAAGVDLAQNFNGTVSEMRIFDTALPEAALITEMTI